MVKDKYETVGPILNEIGQALADVVGDDLEDVFLYVEIDEGWVSANIFKEEGSVVRFFDPPGPSLSDLLFDLWYEESDNPTKRWSVMEYVVKDGKFRASFKYPDEVDVRGEPDDERRQAALRARFGDKPVVYSPMEGMYELKP